MGYAKLIPYATPGFVAFGLFAVRPVGWPKMESRRNDAGIFLRHWCCFCLTALADTPVQIGLGLFVIGMFGAFITLLVWQGFVQDRVKTGMPLAVNGVFGNLGVGWRP
ncbi:MAG: hypothetical protein CM1200mP18_00620 [Gammaproteobacteria bacterium]|nr:MAG: hypothetical protein CM1200mP18_00620 [Gammaproteobacteria bacterium]